MSGLWPHQVRGVAAIAAQKATYLPWTMGSGKSRAIVESVFAHGAKRTLILCPLAVVHVWKREFAKHWPNDNAPYVFVLDDSMSVKQKAVAVEDALQLHAARGTQIVVVCNYDSIWRAPLSDTVTSKMVGKWDMVICDECHRIKAAGGKASMFCSRFERFSHKRVALSGTPMPHSPLDVYAQFRYLDSSIFGRSNTQFKARYAVMGGYMANGRPVQVVGFKNMDNMMAKFNSIAIRMSENEEFQLPQRSQDIVVQLPPKVRKLYKQLEQEFIVEVESGTVTAANALVKSLRLSQLANGFVGLEEGGIEDIHDGKAAALADVLEDLGPTKPVVVFTRFQHDLAQVRKVAEKLGRRVWELSGNAHDIKGIWEPAPGDIAAIQIQAGREGIDLTATNVAIYYSQTYSLGDYDQSRARIKRPGQTESNVLFIHLVSDGTIDWTIRRALRERQDVVKAVMGIGNRKEQAA